MTFATTPSIGRRQQLCDDTMCGHMYRNDSERKDVATIIPDLFISIMHYIHNIRLSFPYHQKKHNNATSELDKKQANWIEVQ